MPSDLEQQVLVRETVYTNYGPIDLFHPPDDRLQGHTPSEDSILLIPPPGLTCIQAFSSFITNETFRTLFRSFRIVGVALPYSDSDSPHILLNSNTLPLIPSEFDFAKRIGDALQQIRMFPTVVVSVGASVGIAQTLAFEAPIMVRSLVAIGPPPPPTRVTRMRLGISNWMLRKFSGNILPETTIESILEDWFGSKTLQRNQTRRLAYERILEHIDPANYALGLRLVNSRRAYTTMQVQQPVLIIQGSETPVERCLDPFFVSRGDCRVEHVNSCGRLSHIESPSFVALCIMDHLQHAKPPRIPEMTVTHRMEDMAALLAEKRLEERRSDAIPVSTQTPKAHLVEPSFRIEEVPSEELLEPASVSEFGGTTMESSRPVDLHRHAPGA